MWPAGREIIMLNEIHHGDCLDLMPAIPAGSVDMVLADLPYETTDATWDSLIPLDRLWAEYRRVIKPGGAIVLTASQPFTSLLVASNPAWFKVEWIWEKNAGSNFGAVKYVPMKEHESILVFGKGRLTYNPVMEERAATGAARVKTIVNYNTGTELYSKGTLNGQASSLRPELRFPRSIQRFNRERGLHPCQKPTALFEYLIRTYSNPGEVVLDNCIGSGTTAVAALNMGRKFIGIEKEARYVEVARSRIRRNPPTLPFIGTP